MTKLRHAARNSGRKRARKNADRAHIITVAERRAPEAIRVAGHNRIQSLQYRGEDTGSFYDAVGHLNRLCEIGPVLAGADICGPANAISAGLTLADLFARQAILRCLVVCPSNIGPLWAEELTSKFGIRAICAQGRELLGALSHSNHPVVVTSYETARERIGHFQPGQFEMIVLDSQSATPPSLGVMEQIGHRMEAGVFQYAMIPSATVKRRGTWHVLTAEEMLNMNGKTDQLSNGDDEFRARFVAGYRAGNENPAASKPPAIFSPFIAPMGSNDTQVEFPEPADGAAAFSANETEVAGVDLLTSHLEKVGKFAQNLLCHSMMSSLQALAAQLEKARAGCPAAGPAICEIPTICEASDDGLAMEAAAATETMAAVEAAPTVETIAAEITAPAETLPAEETLSAVETPLQAEISLPVEMPAPTEAITRAALPAIEKEYGICELTGTSVPADQLIRSDESGRFFRRDEAVTSSESGRVGHRSEVVECCASHTMILKSEADRSSISGKTYSKTLLYPSEKNPDRLGLESELVTCCQTGKGLLVDEAAQSAVSGQWVDRELAVACFRSGRLALAEELVTCEETGVPLLPEETGVCAITNKRVDKSLLGVSAFSGQVALLTRLESCAVSGKAALPSELETCDATKKRVHPTEMETCAVSHKRAIRGKLVRSEISDVLMPPECAVCSPVSKRYCTPAESMLCTWRNVYFPKDEVAQCRLTGLTFSREFLNGAHELKSLRDLLDGKEGGSDGANLSNWLVYSIKGVFRGLKRARCIVSPDGSMRTVCGEIRSMFGLKVRYAGIVVAGKGARQILGHVVVGKRTRGQWTANG